MPQILKFILIQLKFKLKVAQLYLPNSQSLETYFNYLVESKKQPFGRNITFSKNTYLIFAFQNAHIDRLRLRMPLENLETDRKSQVNNWLAHNV